jgi:hypothetical protein
VPLITAQAMASEVDRSAMPIDGLSAVYLPGWLPPNYALIGWMRWVDASGQSVPDVSLVLYLTHRIKGREISPSWSVERLDPELGGCAANYSYIPRQLRVAGRVIRYGNVAFRHKRSEGAVAVCFRGGIAATFHVDVPLPLRVLKTIGIRAMRASG